jgi:hypothetical protein
VSPDLPSGEISLPRLTGSSTLRWPNRPSRGSTCGIRGPIPAGVSGVRFVTARRLRAGTSHRHARGHHRWNAARLPRSPGPPGAARAALFPGPVRLARGWLRAGQARSGAGAGRSIRRAGLYIHNRQPVMWFPDASQTRAEVMRLQNPSIGVYRAAARPPAGRQTASGCRPESRSISATY